MDLVTQQNSGGHKKKRKKKPGHLRLRFSDLRPWRKRGERKGEEERRKERIKSKAIIYGRIGSLL